MRRFVTAMFGISWAATLALGDGQGPERRPAPPVPTAGSREPAAAPPAPGVAGGAAPRKQTAAPDTAAVAARAAQASFPPPPRTLDEALRRLDRITVDTDFRDTTLRDAAAFVGRAGRMNAILAPALAASGADALPRIDLKLTRVRLRQVAELLAKTTGTRLVVRDGILQFTTPEDARGKPVLRIHPLGDLTMRIRNFPGPDIRLHLASAEFEDERESDAESAFDDPEEIVDALRRMTGEGTWDDDQVSISADGRRLVVRQYAEVHREIAAFLALLRAAK